MEKLPYSQKTQELIDKLCELAERKSYTLKKKEAEETILRAYDLFGLPRPKKIVWYTHITTDFSARASRASSAFRANVSIASAFSASRASSAFRAFRASSVSSVSRANVSSASIDYDFDYSVCNFEFIQNPEGNEITDNDKKYFEYSKLIIKAKELGLGYFCDREDTLYLVPVPIISCDEQGRYHSETGPAISWKGAEELYYLHNVKLEKEWWEKIVNDTMSPDEVFAIDNIEHRRIAYEYMDKTKMKQLKDFKVLDEQIDEKGEPMKVVSFNVQNMEDDLIFYNCVCPSTGREYFVQTKSETCSEAKARSFGLENVEWINEW